MVETLNSQKECHCNNYSQKLLMFLEDQAGDSMNFQPKLLPVKKKRLKSNIYYQKKEKLIIQFLLKKQPPLLISSKCSHQLLPLWITLPNICQSSNQDFILLLLTLIGLVNKSNYVLLLTIGPPQTKNIKEVFVLIILLKLKQEIKLLLNYLLLQLYHQLLRLQLI